MFFILLSSASCALVQLHQLRQHIPTSPGEFFNTGHSLSLPDLNSRLTRDVAALDYSPGNDVLRFVGICVHGFFCGLWLKARFDIHLIFDSVLKSCVFSACSLFLSFFLLAYRFCLLILILIYTDSFLQCSAKIRKYQYFLQKAREGKLRRIYFIL